MDLDEGTYLYCFTRPGAVRAITAESVDGRPNVAALTLGDVAAVVSPIALAEFRRALPEDEPPDPEWLIPRACRHERVIEEVMASAPVLPVRFGALFASRQGLEQIVTARCHRICGFLDEIADREEWSVKGFVDPERAEELLLASDPVFARQYSRLPEAPGARYFQEKQLRARARQHVKLRVRNLAEHAVARIRDVAVDVRALGVSMPGRGAEIVLHCACLVRRRHLAGFRACLEMLRSRHAGQGLVLECMGPWPPFNFCPSLEETP